MKKQMKYFVLGIIIIFFSTPLSYWAMDLFYLNKNLTSEFIALLNGFMYSFMLIGTLIFSIGLFSLFKKDKID